MENNGAAEEGPSEPVAVGRRASRGLLPSTEFDTIPGTIPDEVYGKKGGNNPDDPSSARREVPIMPEGQDPLHATLLAATLSQLMLGVSKEIFPRRAYFDLTSVEKQAVADHVRNLLHEAQATFAVPGLLYPRSETAFPPQREEEYL